MSRQSAVPSHSREALSIVPGLLLTCQSTLLFDLESVWEDTRSLKGRFSTVTESRGFSCEIDLGPNLSSTTPTPGGLGQVTEGGAREEIQTGKRRNRPSSWLTCLTLSLSPLPWLEGAAAHPALACRGGKAAVGD